MSRLTALRGVVVIATMIASTAHARSIGDESPAIESLISVLEGRVEARSNKSNIGRPTSNAVSVDSRLNARVRRASDLVVLAGRGFAEGGRTFFVLGVATPSVAMPGGGLCGAGTEDSLLLLEWKARPPRLQLRDSIEVQSCLHSMALASDQGSDLRVVLRGVDDPAKVRLSWLQHPRYGSVTKTLTVSNGSFVLAP